MAGSNKKSGGKMTQKQRPADKPGKTVLKPKKY